MGGTQTTGSTRRRCFRRGGVAAAVFLLAAGGASYLYLKPYVHRTVTEPAGRWSAIVTARRVPPYIEGIEVTLRLQASTGRTFFEKQLAPSLDVWLDVREKFATVEIRDGHLRIGPGGSNGIRSGFYELDAAAVYANAHPIATVTR